MADLQLLHLIPGALQREIDARGLGYQGTARRAGLDRATVSRLARGRVARSTHEVSLRLLLAFDVPPSTLFVVPSPAPDESR